MFKTKEQKISYNKLYRKKHINKIREYQKEYKKTLRFRYSHYRTNAKIRGLVFDLTWVEFKTLCESNCYYCGEEGYGVDRVNSTMGYIKGNIVSCCSFCNKVKSSLTLNEFIRQSSTMLKKIKNIVSRFKTINK